MLLETRRASVTSLELRLDDEGVFDDHDSTNVDEEDALAPWSYEAQGPWVADEDISAPALIPMSSKVGLLFLLLLLLPSSSLLLFFHTPTHPPPHPLSCSSVRAARLSGARKVTTKTARATTSHLQGQAPCPITTTTTTTTATTAMVTGRTVTQRRTAKKPCNGSCAMQSDKWRSTRQPRAPPFNLTTCLHFVSCAITRQSSQTSIRDRQTHANTLQAALIFSRSAFQCPSVCLCVCVCVCVSVCLCVSVCV